MFTWEFMRLIRIGPLLFPSQSLPDPCSRTVAKLFMRSEIMLIYAIGSDS